MEKRHGRQKKIMVGVVGLLLVCGIVFYHAQDDRSSFFIWTDAYLAAQKDEEETIALTFCYQGEPPFLREDILEIAWKDIEEAVPITDFRLEPFALQESGYGAYALFVTYLPQQTGVFATDALELRTKQRERLTYPVGEVVFDTDLFDAPVLDVWGSPAATANSQAFSYAYTGLDAPVSLLEMQIGRDAVISDPNGLPLEGEPEFGEERQSPLKIIRPKLVCGAEGEQVVQYGQLCYCGGVGAETSPVARSKAHWEAVGALQT